LYNIDKNKYAHDGKNDKIKNCNIKFKNI